MTRALSTQLLNFFLPYLVIATFLLLYDHHNHQDCQGHKNSNVQFHFSSFSSSTISLNYFIIGILTHSFVYLCLNTDNPRDTLVVFLSVVAGGTIGLLSLLLTMYVVKSFRKKRRLAKERKKANQGKDGSKIKSVTIEIQGNDEETKEININPGDIIIIDHNDANQSGSEDLGYLSEIVRFYNSQNIGSDDQISIRKPLSSCDSPSVISTTESRDSKYDFSGINVKQCTCQQGPLLRPSSPVEEEG